MILGVVVSAGVLIALSRSADEASQPTAEPSTTIPATTTTETTQERYRPVVSDAMPLESRVDAAVVWTGSELVIWGGIRGPGPYDQPVRVLNDGAALDLDAGTWRVLPASPFPDVGEQVRDDVVAPEAVVTDAGVVVVHAGNTALWDPAEDVWRVMNPAPAQVGTLLASGSEVFSAAANARLDLATGEWGSLPEPPFDLPDPVAAWTGDELVVVGFATRRDLVGQVFDPLTETWRTLADLPPVGGGGEPGFAVLGSGAALGGGWDGERLVLVNGSSYQVVAFDPVTDTWEELPTILPPRLEFTPVPVARVGDQPIVFLNETMMVLDRDLWRPVPYGWLEGDWTLDFWRLAAVRGPGESTVLIPVVDPATDRLVVISLDVLPVLAQREIPIGPITITIPGRWSVTRILPAANVKRMIVELQDGNEWCSVIAGSEDESFVLIPMGTEVTVDHGGDERVWSWRESGATWQYDGGEFVVVVSCGDTSEAIVRSVRFADAE